MHLDSPAFFDELTKRQLLDPSVVAGTADGFRMAVKSLADLLETAGITTFPGSRGQTLACRHFFDDWYLYAVANGSDWVYSLVKLREQEHELEQGLEADGDTPGVTVSFVAFDVAFFRRCLEAPDQTNRRALSNEINRVVAWPKQTHHPALKAYFIRPQAQASYLIARLYVRHIASCAQDGRIPVPDHYCALYEAYRASGKNRRVPEFLEANNHAAGDTVCDHAQIFLRRTECLRPQEELAILATHTGNVSFHSFAAEVRFHALFLTWCAKLPLPRMGSAYASAIRADLSIGDGEVQGLKPYYRLNSRLVRQQVRCHAQDEAKEHA